MTESFTRLARRAAALLVEVLDMATFVLVKAAGDEPLPVEMPVCRETLAAQGAPEWLLGLACCDTDRPHVVSFDGCLLIDGFPHMVALPAPVDMWPSGGN